MRRQFSDENVLHHWHSPTLDEEAIVNPDFYEESGTPCDSDGNDMVYLHTTVEDPLFFELVGMLHALLDPSPDRRFAEELKARELLRRVH